MIPIHEVAFARREMCGDFELIGSLNLSSRIVYYKARGVDFRSHAESRIKAELWECAYGELSKLLRELCYIARLNAAYVNQQRIEELTSQVEALLRMPDAPKDVERDQLPAPVAKCARQAAFVRMFSPRFAKLVEAGTKLQTVRPMPKRMPKPGDKISLRAWTGKPYRSKQRVLREAIVQHVVKIKLDVFDMWFDGMRASEAKQEAFAIADGFSSAGEMLDWFENEYGLNFEGIVIVWRNIS